MRVSSQPSGFSRSSMPMAILGFLPPAVTIYSVEMRKPISVSTISLNSLLQQFARMLAALR